MAHSVTTCRYRAGFAAGAIQAAALRCLCRPSASSSMTLAEKASRSPGLRDVITLWSVTTCESIHFAPALITSVLIEW